MIKSPFEGKKIKDYVSGIDATFSTENMADSVIIAVNDVREIIPGTLYDKLVTPPEDLPAESKELYAEALELLRFTVAPLALYHHFIWLQLRVSNNSITTYKGQDETTAFKYQTDEAKESLIVRYGVFFKELIDYLEVKKEVFTDWNESEQKKDFDKLLIKTYRDFDKSFPTEGNAAFFIRSRVFQQEAYDEINSHIKIDPIITAKEKDEPLIRQLKKALAYLTISRALIDWDTMYLPAPLRRTIASETAPKITPEDLKLKLSGKYRKFAENILKNIDLKIAADQAETDSPDEPIVLSSPAADESDKHYLMM